MSTSTTDLTVADVLRPLDRIPVIGPRTLFKQALEAMNTHRLGLASVVDDDGRLLGIVTDGDVRRMLLREQKPFAALFVDDAIQHANREPTTVAPDLKLTDAVALMEQLEVWDLPVIDTDRRLVGVLHLHPIVKLLLAGVTSS